MRTPVYGLAGRLRFAAKVAAFMLLASAWALAFSSGAPLGRTGGFGQPDCTACHSDFKTDAGRGMDGFLLLDGVPEVYEPGVAYPIVVYLYHPGQVRWGFQLSTRFAGNGAQAGAFEVIDPTYTQVYDFGGPIPYMNQTSAGTYPDTPDFVAWVFNWRAPEADLDTVLFHAAGVAANYNGFPSGDYVYRTAATAMAPGAPDR